MLVVPRSISRRAPRAPRRVAAAMILVAVAALPASAQKPVTAADIENYRLTMSNIEKMVPVARNLKALENDSDVKRWAAEQRAKNERAEETASAADRQSGVAGTNQVIAMYSAHPKVRRAVESAGISVRDYALTMVSIFAPAMVVGMEKQSGPKANTAEMTKGFTGAQRANVDLVRANWTRIEALMKETKKYEMKEPKESSDAAEDEGSEEGDTTTVSRPDRR